MALPAAEWLFPQGSGSPGEHHRYRPASLNSGCTLGSPGGTQNHLAEFLRWDPDISNVLNHASDPSVQTRLGASATEADIGL